MKKVLLTAIAAAGFTTAANAQGPADVISVLNNIDGALATAAPGFQASALAALNGDVTNTFNNFEQAQSGFATDLAAGTPAEALTVPYNDVSRATYNALVPTYQQLDGPSMQFADTLSPATGPTAQAISGFEFDLILDFTAPELPGADALSTDDLPLSADALDPATATALLNGDSLPGL